MKNLRVFTAVILTGAAALTGCSKTEAPQNTPPPPKAAAPAPSPAPAAVAPATAAAPAMPPQPAPTSVAAAAAAVSNAATSAASTATATAQNAAAAAQSSTQGIIDQAKAYIADKKYQPALDSLQKLSNVALTADQQAQVNDLKAQLQKLMNTSAAGAVSNLFGR